MKSGLEDRNNEDPGGVGLDGSGQVSMKSGLEDRNNLLRLRRLLRRLRLNEVRPGRPEQYSLVLYSGGEIVASQ